MQKTFFSIASLLILVPNMIAVTFAIEDWPLTPAPMFAHYVDDSTPRYRFNFEADFGSEAKTTLGYYSVGANWSLMRFFFKYVYGATPSGGVFSIYPHDSHEAFAARLTHFFTAFTSEFRKRDTRPIQTIELWLEQLDGKNATQARSLVGTFNCDTAVFSMNEQIPKE